jgi:anaerobic ribonucleoside-triphosphate reductase
VGIFLSLTRKYMSNEKRGETINVKEIVEEYIDKSDWRVAANANAGYSYGGLVANIHGKVLSNYWLNEIYEKEIGEAHRNGDFHIHDLDHLGLYCVGCSLRTLLEDGLSGIPGKTESAPAKHLDTAVAQIVNFIGSIQNEVAGAVAFSSLDTYLSPFIKKDNLEYQRVKQLMQNLVFNLNIPSRWSSQTPFSNFTFDTVCPEDMRKKQPIIGGEIMDFTYGDCQTEMDLLNRCFLEVMEEGDWHGRVFTFPIPTYNITKDFDWESENSKLLFSLSAKYGTPYFQNFINSPLKPGDVRSMCCRLQLDLRELRARGGGLFGSAEQTGSVGVITINLARIGFTSKTKEEYFKRLGQLLVLAKDALEVKRETVTSNIYERGLFPFVKRFIPDLHAHFSTIGINGMNESIRNFIPGCDITKDFGKEFALEVMDFIRNKLADFQEETGNMYNLEATPAEGTTYRFAKEDKKRYPGILQAGTDEVSYYTNSSQLPVGHTENPIEALDHQDELQTKYTGGTVLHLFLGERIKDWKTAANFIKKVAENYHLPYFTLTPTFSICPSHGYLNGEVEKCPDCDSKCEVWSRVMGYHRPVSQWNIGKRQEFADRKEYKLHPLTNPN